MHSHSARNCYCQTPVPTVCQRDEIYTERDRSRLNSNRSFPKTQAGRCGSELPWNWAKILDEELLDSKGSTVSSPSTAVLSPETTTALENAERVLKDAHMQIKEIKLASSYNPTRSNVKMLLEEPPLEDKDDQLLYIRERVLFKFQEADRWVDYKNKIEHDENVYDFTRRTVDLSAPKFKTLGKRYEQPFKRETFADEENAISTERTEFRDSSNNGDTVYEPNGEIIIETGKIQKMRTLCIQAGPSVNIERKLVAQNLEEVHISPDSSVAPKSTNVGTYNFHHDFRVETASASRGEKCVRIVETNVSGDSSLIRKSKSAEISKDNLRDNNAHIEEQERLAEEGQSENKSLSNDTNVPLLISKDFGSLQHRRPKEKDINEKLERPIYDILKNDRQSGIINITTCDPIITAVARHNTPDEKDCPKVSTQFVQTDQHNDKCYEVQLNDPSGFHQSLDIDVRKNIPALSKEERRKRKMEKHYNDINEQFANVHKLHCNQHKETMKSNDHNKLLRVDTSESESENAEENSLYHPCMSELDDILITYSKMIDDINRDTRTIEKFLSRPEIVEYCISDDRTSSESCTSPRSPPLGKCKVESTKAANPGRRLTKQNVDRRSTNLMIKNQLATMNKDQELSKVSKTNITKTMQRKVLLPANGNKDSDRQKKYVVSRSVGKFAVHIQPNVTKRFRFLKKKLRNNLNEDTKESSINSSIDKRLVIKHTDANRVHLLEEDNQRQSYSLHPVSDSSGITSSLMNPLSSCTELELQSLSNEKITQKNCRSVDGGVAASPTNLKTNTASTRHHKSEEIDLEKGISGYSELCNIVEDVIARVFEDEKQNVENKLKNSLKEAEIAPIVVKNLLEQFQGTTLNSTVENLELPDLKTFETHDKNVTWSPQHVQNVQEISECELEEQDLPTICPEINENLIEAETIKRDKNVTEENIDHRKSACSSNNQPGVKNVYIKLHSGNTNFPTTNEIEKTVSDNESLNEISNIKSDENNDTENVEASRDQNKVHVEFEPGKEESLKGDENTRTIDVNQDIVNTTSSISGNKETKSVTHTILCGTTPALHGNHHSLRDLTFSRVSTSPGQTQEISPNKMHNNDAVARQVTEINEASEVAVPFADHINDQKSNNHPIKKGTIKDAESIAGLYENRSSNILPSALSTYNSLPLNSRRGSNNSRVQTPLDTSYSEGELCLPSSSCSYSLGEVRIVERNDLLLDNATEYDKSVAVYVTRSMLNSWNESSSSLVESLGEI